MLKKSIQREESLATFVKDYVVVKLKKEEAIYWEPSDYEAIED